ncbi:hypothetical protein [Arenimonas sp.]|uniref:hypothetical protein n=1 Tax=Arenimonas sp. TaxID=1872635 RepID=UPI0025C62E6A|nr:hypothetical protein [Arenimonas sp.]
MQFQLDLWSFVLALLALLGGFGGVLLKVGHVLIKGFVTQFEKRLNERHIAEDKAADEMRKRLDRSFADVEKELRTLERGQAAIKEEMLREYVRREDAIRDQTVTQAKLDALHARIELLTRLVTQLEANSKPRNAP